MQEGCAAEMPRYQSHKQVWALKIKSIEDPNTATDGSRMLVFEEAGYSPICVTGSYMAKHDPQVGGYYVVYDDGYVSWSPASAFEQGYTRVSTLTVTAPENELVWDMTSEREGQIFRPASESSKEKS